MPGHNDDVLTAVSNISNALSNVTTAISDLNSAQATLNNRTLSEAFLALDRFKEDAQPIQAVSTAISILTTRYQELTDAYKNVMVELGIIPAQ